MENLLRRTELDLGMGKVKIELNDKYSDERNYHNNENSVD